MATDSAPHPVHNGITRHYRARRTTTMATKKITPVNPDTRADDEVEAKDAADRKRASLRIGRKSARKTNQSRFF